MNNSGIYSAQNKRGGFIMSATKDELIRKYVKAIHEGNAAVFAGAGLSRASGYVDWKGLLRPLANDIGLDVDKETDLLSVAQFYRNRKGVKTPISQEIIKAFTKDVDTNENINILSRLPIYTYWTTNYDALLEEGIKKANRKPDVKKDSNQLTIIAPDRDAIVYKMHGDVEHPAEAVLTKSDYELYPNKYPMFRTILKGDLISKVFLFIGFSFQDPNLDYVLGQIHSLLGEHVAEHFCFFKRVQRKDYKKSPAGQTEYGYDLARQEMQEENLRLYGIQTVFVDSFSEITEILHEIEKAYKMSNIFISGSASDYELPWTADKAEKLAKSLAKELIMLNCRITSGFGFGIGSFVVNGALDVIYSEKYRHMDEHLCLRPFPQNVKDSNKKKEMWKKYREDMLNETGIAIFMFGNKMKDGKIVEGSGCIEEYKIAKKKGNLIIPIGSTGFAAKTIFEDVKKNIDKYPYLTPYMDILEKETNISKLVKTIVKIVKEQSR